MPDRNLLVFINTYILHFYEIVCSFFCLFFSGFLFICLLIMSKVVRWGESESRVIVELSFVSRMHVAKQQKN